MRRLLKKFGDLQVAITFAEAGEFDTARQTLKEEQKADERRKKRICRSRRILWGRLRHAR